MKDVDHVALDHATKRDHASHGTAEIGKSGVDLSQLRANRRLTPAQRLDKLSQATRFTAWAQSESRKRRHR